MSSALPDPIRSFLCDFVARRRRLALIKAAALALAMFLAVLLIVCTADRLLHLPRAVRGVLLFADIIAVVLILRRPVADALRSHADWVEAAAQVEAVDSAFAQRLMTVTSQIQSDPSHRGSSSMLAALVDEVSVLTSKKRGAELISFRHIRRSITLAGCFLAVTFSTLAVPWFQMPRLIGRFTRPWANLPAVTTTQLDVTPGSATTPQGRSLHVSVAARKLNDSPVQLHFLQGEDWLITPLQSSDAEHFIGDTPPLDRDTRYFVTGGDAQSDVFDVHVMSTPGLKEIRATVIYPQYLQMPEKTLTVVDGKLEVPAGSVLNLSLVATEPLSDATLVSQAGQREPTTASVDPSVRTAKLQVKKEWTASVVLKSSQGVEQKISQPLTIRPIQDRPPLVRLLAPTEELRLTPLDLLTTAGQVLDDYGVESVQLQIKINERSPIYQAIPITGDRRRIEQAIECDMAQLGVEPGDLLQLSLLAKDGSGQQVGSEVIRITISPRSFDLNDFLRLADLKSAAKLADELMSQLSAAREALGQSPDSIAKEGDKSLQNLSAAAQTAQLLTRPLLRADTRANVIEVSDAISQWLDVTEQCRSIAEELQDQRARKLDPNQIAGPLDQARSRLEGVINLLQRTIRHDQLLAVRNDAMAARELALRTNKSKGAEREKLERSAGKLLAAAQSGAKSLDVRLTEDNGKFPELESIIGETETVLRGQPRIDFAAESRRWQGILQNVSPGNLLATGSQLKVLALESRLAMASQAESVRPGADFVRARDWALAARAGRAICGAAVAPAVPDAIKSAVGEFPAAVADLQAAHAMNREPQKPSDAASILAKAQAARDKMRRWAGDRDAQINPAGELASLDAAAAQQEGLLDRAKELDESRLAGRMSKAMESKIQSQQALMKAAQQIQMLQQQQEQLAKKTAKFSQQAKGDSAAQAQFKALAQQQQQTAQSIQQARKQQSPSDAGQDQAKADPAELIADLRAQLTALRQQNEVIKAVKDQAVKVEQAKQLDAAGVDAANQKLTKISPVADAAQRQVDDKVVGGARQLQQEARDQNAAAVGQQSGELEAAIQESMKKLNDAEEKLAERDAMAAAESAAQQAAQQMAQAARDSKDPAEQAQANGKNATGQPVPVSAEDRAQAMAAATQAQQRALSSLDQAVARSAQSGGQARVRESSVLDSLFSLLPILIDGNGAGPGSPAQAKLEHSAAREWGRMRPRNEQNQTAVSTPADPAGYEQSLKWYFEALGKKSE